MVKQLLLKVVANAFGPRQRTLVERTEAAGRFFVIRERRAFTDWYDLCQYEARTPMPMQFDIDATQYAYSGFFSAVLSLWRQNIAARTFDPARTKMSVTLPLRWLR